MSIQVPTQDIDAVETQEWIDALTAVTAANGSERAQYLLRRLEDVARRNGVFTGGQPFSSYRNTIPVAQQGHYPGDLDVEERLTSIIRWNALAMVVRANKAYGELGGHIASYASAAEIFETGFNHFFRAQSDDFGGDLVYFQPHSAPGVYARAFLEGRLSEERLANYRQEVGGNGLCSYPHPWLMPDFWQFPTGSMGIGPMSAIYQARYMRYLEGRGLANTAGRHVWGVFGDGEMDEPESIGALTLAARENLDNLTFIVNCNLQRLDGPVRGNGQIIQELESLFIGAGWNVIKVLWGSEWDNLFARDKDLVLLRRFAETVDGEYQDLGSKDGDYNRAKFFDRDPATRDLVMHMTDGEINALKRGGHDFRKLYAAFAAAKAHKGRPTVILAKTKKGFGMGDAGESRMTAHQSKKLDMEALVAFRDRFGLPLTEKDLEELKFYKPAADSPEMKYLHAQRETLGGYMPRRRAKTPEPKRLIVPDRSKYARFATEADGKVMSTTMAAVRMLGGLLKDKTFGPRIVPIVADEARTFGMDNLFRQIGIYAPQGQLYEPEDAGSMMFYKEAKNGQLLEEGITEAGAISSWSAAATSYSVHDTPTLPFYIYYSMFGFQRVGDLIWAAADQRARGFLLGATAGRTTLSGEGLQHQDGTSHVIAATVPNCRAYDPAYAYELAVIMDDGMKRMMEDQADEFYYLTVMNENYAQPSMPDGAEQGILKGLYQIGSRGEGGAKARLIGSGTILTEVIAAADMLATDYGIATDLFSATSFSELARDARAVERENRLGGTTTPTEAYVSQTLAGSAPIVAATDYVRAVPQMIAPYVDARFIALGTDGFGRSANRADLRAFFEVDRKNIALAVIEALVRAGDEEPATLAKALDAFSLDASAPAPWTV
ncbi:pyruvate dehydrogenase [Salipiger aestuarii]|uniref:Pyruvate dehydrogenase E1 component n=1 Tax=Salipiger thiooxidans TaxID=282683 RepID=A0A1G7JIX6_9RHOB|nr:MULTISPECIES: alpha-ketoglutarate dehydrogenase [Rhodobacterales]KAA8605741.1 pyruvate dehydrogenase [Salipiger aestuarii]KAA8612176.1 pyruvate dehydrogenase [Salipiger aestuarii]KMK64071.1 pyruvate dehydrogenase E1 component, homodimeric type [Puniceibacterium sp. IMCC21224]SDF24734.1 pyruvate dehydrogenase E1 component [Salipiger thiooxidans]